MFQVVNALHRSVVFDRRVRVLSNHLTTLIPPRTSVLDVGCGDGTIDRLLTEQRPDISLEGIDVLLRPVTQFPVKQFDGSRIPYDDASFDVVMFVDVLHHTEDPTVLLSEASRVARRAIVLKDHFRDGPAAHTTLRLMDWIGNAAHGVALPYNYWSRAQWMAAFRNLQIEPEEIRTRLRLYPFPASLVFERGLHFLARLRPQAHSSSRAPGGTCPTAGF